jgi:hypothetical protein
MSFCFKLKVNWYCELKVNFCPVRLSITKVCMCNSLYILNGNLQVFVCLLITIWRLAYPYRRTYCYFWLFEYFIKKFICAKSHLKWQFFKTLQIYCELKVNIVQTVKHRPYLMCVTILIKMYVRTRIRFECAFYRRTYCYFWLFEYFIKKFICAKSHLKWQFFKTLQIFSNFLFADLGSCFVYIQTFVMDRRTGQK